MFRMRAACKARSALTQHSWRSPLTQAPRRSRQLVSLQRAAAFDRGGAVGARRAAARQRRVGPHRRRRSPRATSTATITARIFRHIAQLIEQDKPADVVTVAESIERAKTRSKTGRHRLPRRAGAEHAVGAQHPPLRRDRARARDHAPAGRGRHRNRRQRAQPAWARRSGSCSTRPSRRCSRSPRRARGRGRAS